MHAGQEQNLAPVAENVEEASKIQGIQREVHAMTGKWEVVTGTH